MSYEIKMVTCGNHDSIEGTELCFPITNTMLFDLKKIKPYIDKHSKSVFFIIVLLHLFGQTIDLILAEIGSNDNIIGIFVCVNQIFNLTNNQTNIFHLSKRLLTCKTTSYAIHSYESASKKLYQTNHAGHAYILKQTSSNLKEWLTTSDKVKACDVLLIPLNTDDANLYDFQQRMIEFCQALTRNSEQRVCTLYDFISSDESGSNMSNENQAFVNQQNKIICSLIKKLAPIRIYIVGNEEAISNNWSKLMIENEEDNSDQTAPQYDQRCTFVKNEPVSIEIIDKLVHHYGNSWKVTIGKPKRLDDDIAPDFINFLGALDQSHTTLEAREMVANIELSLWAMDYHENSTEHSTKFHTIEEPQSIRMASNSSPTEEMNNRIQWYQRSSSNSDNDA